mmetsp:Transcript_16086/g.32574  ORF Transcript_16086/g.32574 Transcript_16086/m.32574 type:complete len:520 (-) Transcript_16086:75-1634(-)
MADFDDGDEVEWNKYDTYALPVNPDQDDKATVIKLCNFTRPHMRAFHCAWGSYFISFFMWFSITPLLSEIRDTLDFTNEQIWTSSITGVAGTIFVRFLLGPFCDKVGSRVLITLVLCLAAIPTACTGLVNTPAGLAVLRLFIGIAGGTFVMSQYWSSRMFTKEVVGTANALVAGWGNLGGGVTQLIMGTVLFPAFKNLFDGDSEKAWRTVCVVPAAVAVIIGIIVYFITDDAPKGNYKDLKMHGNMPEVSAAASFRSGACNINTWLLFIQYAACLGAELTMNNAAALYYKDEFDQTTESAAALASIFGWTNLFARGLGGYLSDRMNSRLGMRGRLLLQTCLLAAEGALVLIFCNVNDIGAAVSVMVCLAICSQAASGSTYGIVPYVDPPATGSIAGIVGAGGNTGAVAFGFGFLSMSYKDAFILMGSIILGTSLLSVFILIKGQSGLLFGKAATPTKVPQTLAVPVDKEHNSDHADQVEDNKNVEETSFHQLSEQGLPEPAPRDDQVQSEHAIAKVNDD